MQSSSFWIIGSATLVVGGLVAACGGSEFQSTDDGLTSPRDAGTSDDGSSSGAGVTGSGGANGGDGGGANPGGGGARNTGGANGGGGDAGGGGANGGGGGVLSEGGPTAGGEPGDGTAGAGGSVDGGGNGGGGGNIATGGAAGSNAGGAGGCAAERTYYPDTDTDGFGRSTGTVLACSAPASGTWSVVGGDCDDDDLTVFPNEPTYYAVPHGTAGGNHSYDYDCSGNEEGDPSQGGAAPASCTGLLSCTGSGYVATSRTGVGVNPLCGSTTISACKPNGLLATCTAVRSDTTAVYRCK